MSSQFEDFIQQVKKRVDIVDVIGEYVELKKVGKNYQALCPFHQEKTPSFTVNPENQVYHCFGCKVGGDVFTFLMEMDHITFYESLKILADRTGLEMPEQSQAQKEKTRRRDRMFAINNMAARFYNYILLNNETAARARSYLEERNFTDSEIESFNLGYAPDHWQVLLDFLTDRGYAIQDLLEAGLISESKQGGYFDKFRDRIIFPIENIRGEVLAFGGRKIKDEDPSVPKYLNSPTTLIYDKGKNLYGIHQSKTSIRQKKQVIIMEGYTDVLRAHQAGFTNTVASLGTALTREQARVIDRLAEMVYIVFDPDIAGKKAALKGLDILKSEGLNIKVLDLPEDQDPDDFIADQGPDAFQKMLDQADGLIDYKIKQAAADKDPQKTEDKINLIKSVIKILSDVEDQIEREVYVDRISSEYSIDREIIKKEIEKRIKRRQEAQQQSREADQPAAKKTIKNPGARLVKIFIDYPEYRSFIQENIDPDYFEGRLKKAARILWQNIEQDFDIILQNIEDEEVKNLLMNLAVMENVSVNKNVVSSWVERMRENIFRAKKKQLSETLQKEEDINVDELNRLLLKYKKMQRDFLQEV